MTAPLDILETEFCPPLESALVYAIFHDFEDDPTGVDKARELLNSIKQSAVLEQETDFDPSASGGQARQTNSEIASEGTNLTENSAPWSRSTGLTGSSNEPSSRCTNEKDGSASTSSLDISSTSQRNYYIDSVEALNPVVKEAQLAEFFPTLKLSLVAYTLRKCNWSFAKATDELLNHVYFESASGQERVSSKSVDAFFLNDPLPRGRKGKAKKSRKLAITPDMSPTSPSPTSPGDHNRWKTGTQAVEFIASRARMTPAEVASIFHRNGGSARATLQAIIDTDVQKNKGGGDDDPILVENAIELVSDFPSIDLVQALSLTRIAHPSTADAHELAKLLTTMTLDTPKGGLQIIPRYAPIDHAESSLESTPTSPVATPLSPKTPLGNLSTLAEGRNKAFSQATAAHRKGKSDPLMRAVAGYYGQVGRDYDAAFKAATSAEADALVRSQSSPTQLDLHGVSVKDATRIARESVTAWWHGLGEGQIKGKGVGAGYRIVTGVGNHSEGGKGRIGPAVGRMLVREGWRVEFGTGFLVIKGIAKTK